MDRAAQFNLLMPVMAVLPAAPTLDGTLMAPPVTGGLSTTAGVDVIQCTPMPDSPPS